MTDSVFEARDLDEIIYHLRDQIRRFEFGPQDIAVPVMTGAIHFASDLLRALEWEGPVMPICARSYGLNNSQGEKVTVAWTPNTSEPTDELRIQEEARARILIIDTVIETGMTVNAIDDEINRKMPWAGDVYLAVMFDKSDHNHYAPVRQTFIGQTIPREQFLVGYGMDSCGRNRNTHQVWTSSVGRSEDVTA